MNRLALLSLVLGFGCSDTVTNSDGTSATKAQSDCNVFINSVYCTKIVSCANGGIDQPTCVAAAETGFDCAKVVSENGEVATCETQIGSDACSVLIAADGTVTLPAACSGVFLTKP